MHGGALARTAIAGAGRAALLSAMASSKRFVLDPFVLRQFDDPAYTGTRIDFDKQAFENTINDSDAPLVDGYGEC